MDIISVIEQCNINRLDSLLISFDFKKAFDKVEWPVLFKVLDFFNFGDRIISIIKILYYDIESCVINNGISSNWFKLSRSVRQGDPLSSSLFFIIIEVLSLKIKSNPNIIGIFDHHKPHAQFADDIRAVIRNMQESFDQLMQVFDEFSGLRINYEKTQVLNIGRNGNENENLVQIVAD